VVTESSHSCTSALQSNEKQMFSCPVGQISTKANPLFRKHTKAKNTTRHQQDEQVPLDVAAGTHQFPQASQYFRLAAKRNNARHAQQWAKPKANLGFHIFVCASMYFLLNEPGDHLKDTNLKISRSRTAEDCFTNLTGRTTNRVTNQKFAQMTNLETSQTFALMFAKL